LTVHHLWYSTFICRFSCRDRMPDYG
jgi:hypothetical protein